MLDLACDWALHLSDEAGVVQYITTGAYNNLGKEYDGGKYLIKDGYNLTKILKDEYVDCTDMAVVVCLFTRAAGGSTVQMRRVNGEFFYRKLLPIGLSEWKTGKWIFHQFAWFDDKVYDACVKINEMSPYIPAGDDYTNYQRNVWHGDKFTTQQNIWNDQSEPFSILNFR